MIIIDSTNSAEIFGSKMPTVRLWTEADVPTGATEAEILDSEPGWSAPAASTQGAIQTWAIAEGLAAEVVVWTLTDGDAGLRRWSVRPATIYAVQQL